MSYQFQRNTATPKMLHDQSSWNRMQGGKAARAALDVAKMQTGAKGKQKQPQAQWIDPNTRYKRLSPSAESYRSYLMQFPSVYDENKPGHDMQPKGSEYINNAPAGTTNTWLNSEYGNANFGGSKHSYSAPNLASTMGSFSASPQKLYHDHGGIAARKKAAVNAKTDLFFPQTVTQNGFKRRGRHGAGGNLGKHEVVSKYAIENQGVRQAISERQNRTAMHKMRTAVRKITSIHAMEDAAYINSAVDHHLVAEEAHVASSGVFAAPRQTRGGQSGGGSKGLGKSASAASLAGASSTGGKSAVRCRILP